MILNIIYLKMKVFDIPTYHQFVNLFSKKGHSSIGIKTYYEYCDIASYIVLKTIVTVDEVSYEKHSKDILALTYEMYKEMAYNNVY